MLGIWDRLRTSFWFLPSAMAAGAVALSFGLIRIDTWLGARPSRELAWVYSFGPEGARAVLSTIAGSMITVAGLTFSITMLTLQLASSQFGPRLLRSFMRDRGNQVVLGTFVSTFLYCLLVLRTVRGVEGSSFVPHVSVAVGVLLATLSLAVLIYFIHHVAISIRIETVLADLAAEAVAAVDRLYPERAGPGSPVADGPLHLPGESGRRVRSVGAGGSGYVQRVDDAVLMQIATEHDLLVRIAARPGRFVTKSDALLSVSPGERVTDRVEAALRDALVVGPDRTSQQDLEYSLRRIVEIAQRALSPGINDPTTALYCIDRLGEVLVRLTERGTPSPVRTDESGQPRVLSAVDTIEGLACPALAAVARYGLEDADVICRLLEVVEAVGRRAPPAAREALTALGRSIQARSEERLCIPFDKVAVDLAASGGVRPAGS